jgi:hypothetical protein
MKLPQNDAQITTKCYRARTDPRDYIRAINGEVRLWVNGEEVSGGTACDPADGFICLESEGSPIHFRRLRIRELP